MSGVVEDIFNVSHGILGGVLILTSFQQNTASNICLSKLKGLMSTVLTGCIFYKTYRHRLVMGRPLT